MADKRHSDSFSGQDDVYGVRRHSRNDSVLRKARVGSLRKGISAKASVGHKASLGNDFIRLIPESMGLTTAQQRTRATMFG